MAGSDEKKMAYNYCPNCGAKMVELQERNDKHEPRKPGRPKKTKVQPVEPKKRGRKPKTEPKTKEPVAAGQKEEAKQEALKGLVEIADRWINGRKVDADRYKKISGRKVDADRYKKISEDIDAQVKQYQGYIDTVKEMIQ